MEIKVARFFFFFFLSLVLTDIPGFRGVDEGAETFVSQRLVERY
jgi:hypothetical protein